MNVSSGIVMSLPWLLLLSVLCAAVWTDCSSRRIPNGLIALGLGCGLLWQWLGPQGAWSFDPDDPGATGVGGWLLAGGGLLLAFLPFFALGIMGAGDVKLMWVVGGMVGGSPGHWDHLAGIVLGVLLSGGVLALYRMCRLGIYRQVLGNLVRLMRPRRGPLDRPLSGSGQSADRMPYAVAIALGSLGYLLALQARWLLPD